MMQICLDGPSGSGKSTIAKELAKQLNITYLDTGAMYRALTYYCLDLDVDFNNPDDIIKTLTSFHLTIDKDRVVVNGKDITAHIRSARVTQNVSTVAAIETVRKKMVDLQRAIGEKSPIVMDGRDIGTVVLPHATYKFFITADPVERASRRHHELLQKGVVITFEDVYEDMLIRDQKDSTREVDPLKAAEDAILIDTSHLSINEVVTKIVSYIEV
jgi:cytidylate kinase